MNQDEIDRITHTGQPEYLNPKTSGILPTAGDGSIQPDPPVQHGRPSEDESDLSLEPSLSNIRKYMTAEASLHLEGPVRESEYRRRAAACSSCPERVEAPDEDDLGFCRACGCGRSKRARLTVKLTMPKTTCPLGRFQQAPGRHPRLLDRAKAAILRRLLP